MTAKKTIADLRAAHDRTVIIPNRIKSALAALKLSGDAWHYEVDFMQRVKPALASRDVAAYRDQFKDYWAEMPSTDGKRSARVVWFATPALKREWESQTNG